ncbi:hypothetical protein CcaCcLH18_12035 [Colletotrichum camelliae]|nr:hypothetical protein CcaCcLH18_12035 [Colletotrichum camelliae]
MFGVLRTRMSQNNIATYWLVGIWVTVCFVAAAANALGYITMTAAVMKPESSGTNPHEGGIDRKHFVAEQGPAAYDRPDDVLRLKIEIVDIVRNAVTSTSTALSRNTGLATDLPS